MLATTAHLSFSQRGGPLRSNRLVSQSVRCRRRDANLPILCVATCQRIRTHNDGLVDGKPLIVGAALEYPKCQAALNVRGSTA